jgi:hypothetical protein
VVAGWLLVVAGCWSRGAKKNTQISKDSTTLMQLVGGFMIPYEHKKGFFAC